MLQDVRQLLIQQRRRGQSRLYGESLRKTPHRVIPNRGRRSQQPF